MQSDIYQKARYLYKNGTIEENRYIFMHYNIKMNTFSFKDYNGSTLINMSFKNWIPNKATAINLLYNLQGENITKEEFENNI